MEKKALERLWLVILAGTMVFGLLSVTGCGGEDNPDPAEPSAFESGTGSETDGDAYPADRFGCSSFDENPDWHTSGFAEQVLATVYAGIGYMNAADETDNELLYNIMVEDLNMLSGSILQETLANNKITLIDLFGLGIGQTLELTYDRMENGIVLYASTLDLNITPTGLKSFDFSGTLRVDFNADGYPLDDKVVYFGDRGISDLTADAEGSVVVESNIGHFVVTPSLSSLVIHAKETLSAQYQNGESDLRVTYGDEGGVEWNLSYYADAVWNVMLLPYKNVRQLLVANGYLDFRDYTVGGRFTIGTSTYEFTEGFRYVQIMLAGAGLNFGKGIFISGDLKIPCADKFVTVSHPLETNQLSDLMGTPLAAWDTLSTLLTQKVIRRDIPPQPDPETVGIWESGIMTLGLENGADEIKIEFSLDEANTGVADFHKENDDDFEAWSVTDWQDALDGLAVSE